MNTMRYKGATYYLPEAGDLIMKAGKAPYVSLRCTSPKQQDEWLDLNLPPTLAVSARETLETFVSQGYEVADFCIRGTMTIEPFGYDVTQQMEICKKLRIVKVSTPYFVGTQVVQTVEFEIRSSERPVLHINPNTGEVLHRKKLSSIVMGNITSLITEAKVAREAERDFKYGHLFIWKRRSKESILLQEFITELESLAAPVTKKVLKV